jgi:hypothetical protein
METPLTIYRDGYKQTAEEVRRQSLQITAEEVAEVRATLERLQDRYLSTINPETGLPPLASKNPWAWQSKAAAAAEDARGLLAWLDDLQAAAATD